MRHTRLALVLLAVGALTACSAHLQTTSGSDYLARYNDSPAAHAGATPDDVDDAVRRIAAIEPDLRFPARIGLARIDRGGLIALPADEGYIWQDVATKLGPLYGEFVPVSPLIAATVSDQSRAGAGETIAHIRRGAARQHLDYVLIYEVGTSRQEKANALALADLTIIGMFVLPSRSIEVEASASAIMLDVRTGYPYATLTAHAEKSGISRVISDQSTGQSLIDTAEERAVANLANDVETAMEELAERSLAMTSNDVIAD